MFRSFRFLSLKPAHVPVDSPALMLSVALALLVALSAHAAPLREQVKIDKGIVLLVGLPTEGAAGLVDWVAESELTVLMQTADGAAASAVRAAGARAGVLGNRLFVEQAPTESLSLAANVADQVIVHAPATAPRAEVLRVLRPQGVGVVGEERFEKPTLEGADPWTHPYHGPDNNPQSQDQRVRGEFRTHFLAEPTFSPMPEQSVAAGGRLYKAMGHIAHKANQNEWLNKLLCINAYNGVILWTKPMPEGFMLHRNTMIATDEHLLMGDHESCKVIDGASGRVVDQITVPAEITDGPVWKWMAVREGVLYALVGNPEIRVDVQRSDRRGLGHWPWGMWKGHDYKDPRTAFGYGRTLVAIDLRTKRLLWHYRDKEFLDARGVCMAAGKIYCCTPERFLACVDAESGELLWKNSDADLLAAIGPNERAQHYTTGYSTTCYIKCDAERVYFAGPQRPKMVVASGENGKLLWTHPAGNVQLVLREDAIYAAGQQGTQGVRLAYDTGSVLNEFPARRACTRATGCVDSIFYRASGGTVRVLTESNTAQHIAPMRPPCQDGVLISNGHLYWGPWMCGCQLSFYGHVCLEPALAPGETADPRSDDPSWLYRDALVAARAAEVPAWKSTPGDWDTYRGGNARDDVTRADVPDDVALRWTADVCRNALPTAPIVADGRVFLADRTGAVHAFDRQGARVWTAYTGGPVYYPPTLHRDRLLVGSADGRVYAFAAADGRFLWSFRVGPRAERIPVFGKLISRWPVAGGAVARDGLVYAAAGLAHYDGTYLVALDVATGELKASNTTSGKLAERVNGGISMQGNLAIVDQELQFLGGGVYEVARYDLQKLTCLNEPREQVTSEYRTAFYPLYPEYGRYLSMEHTCSNGATLCHDASYEGSVFTDLALEAPLPPGVNRPRKEAARWFRRRGKEDQAPKTIWQDRGHRRFTSFVIGAERLVAAGHPDGVFDQHFLAAIDIEKGADVWSKPLPSLAVKGGVAIDSAGRLYVALENGQLQCYAP